MSTIPYVNGNRPTDYNEFKKNGGVCEQFSLALNNILKKNGFKTQSLATESVNVEVDGQQYFKTVDVNSLKSYPHGIVEATIDGKILWIDPTVWSSTRNISENWEADKEWLIKNTITNVQERAHPCHYEVIGSIFRIDKQTKEVTRIKL